MSLGLRVLHEPCHRSKVLVCCLSGCNKAMWAVSQQSEIEMTTRGSRRRRRTLWGPTRRWWRDGCPDKGSSHPPGSWHRTLSHRTPMKPGGQWQRWWWWHVPPFWQRSNALSHTRAVKSKKGRGKRREGLRERWLTDQSVTERQNISSSQKTSWFPFPFFLYVRGGETNVVYNKCTQN